MTETAAPPAPATEPSAAAIVVDESAPGAVAPATDGAPTPPAAAAPAAGAEGAPAPAAADAGPPRFVDERRRGITARRREERAAPITDESLLAGREAAAASLPPSAAPAEPSQSAAPVPAPAAAAPSPAPAPAPISPFTRVKVNGMNFDVPSAEVAAAGGVAAYQLQKATEASLRSVKSLETELRQRLAAPPPAPTTPTATAPAPAGKPAARAPAAVSYKDAARQLHDAVLESNVDSIATVLESLGSAPVTPAASAAPAPAVSTPVPASAPARQINRSKDEILGANAIFDREFAHLAGNPEAFAAAREQIVARMQNPHYDNFPLDMLVRDIGARITTLTGGMPPAPAPAAASVASALDLRRQVKQRLPASSTAGSAVPAAAAPAPSRPVRASTYIQRLRGRSGSNTALAERGATR